MQEHVAEIDTVIASDHEVGEVLTRRQRVLELILLVAVVATMGLLHQVPDFKMVILNVYFLPVALSAFYLGRYRATVMAFLCVLSATYTTIIDLTSPNSLWPPLINSLTLVVWGLVLETMAWIIGSLSDQRSKQFEALHESHKSGVLSDGLTGIANRRAFDQELTRQISKARKANQTFALILVDIDHFKTFNDTYGHRAGDAVLRDVAATLHTEMRSEDLVARFGGEEFGIILPGVCAAEAIEASELARKSIESSCYRFEGLALRLTVSVGVSHCIKDEDHAAILERTDTALYTSKQCGRNCTHYHNGKSCERIGHPADHQESMRPEASRSDIYTDELTGLPRALVLTRELQRRVEEARRYDTTLSLMIVQIKDFTATRQAEKKAMSILAEAIDANSRSADLVARLCSDQFGLLMPSTGLDAAITPARRIHSDVAARQDAEGPVTPFTVAIGLAELSAEDLAETLIERVMEALAESASMVIPSICLHDGQKVVPGSCIGSYAEPT